MAKRNPCGRQVTPDMAYEVWQSFNKDFTTYVLKKKQLPDQEMKNPYATWYVATKSPGTFDGFDFGDTYVNEVKGNMILVDNPLCSYLCIKTVSPEHLLALGIPTYHQTDLEEKYSLLHSYYRVAIPKSKLQKFKNRLREFIDIRIVCENDANYMLTCERDALSRKETE